MSKKTLISFAQSALLVLLLFAMLVQCVFFIRLTQNYSDSSLPLFPENEMRLLGNSGFNAAESGKSTVIPYFVGAITDKGRYAGIYDDTLAAEVFGCFAQIIENASGGTAKKVAFSDAGKKYDYLDTLYNSTESCYYVKLKNGIEFSVLCQLMSDTYNGIPESPGFVIEDMFLVKGAAGESSITAVDADGNVLKIYPSKNIAFNSEYLEAYNNTEKNEFEFVRITENTAEEKNCYFPAFKYSIKYKSIVKENFLDYFILDPDSTDIKNFVGIFGMNDDNTRFYRRSSDGAVICVEDTTSLEITPDGKFTFLAGDDSSTLGSILGQSENTKYGFFDYANAARNIVLSLNEAAYTGCGMLSVDDIAYADGLCSFCYNYTVNGIPLENGGAYSLKLNFSEDALVSAQGRIEVFAFGDEAKTEMPQKTAYVLMDKSKGTILYFGPEYRLSEDPMQSGKAYIKWSVKYGIRNGGMQ